VLADLDSRYFPANELATVLDRAAGQESDAYWAKAEQAKQALKVAL
jgi:hypothetical protein